MVFSLAGFVGLSFFQGDPNALPEEKYNDFTFSQYGSSWRLDVNGQAAEFYNFPKDVESINLPDTSFLQSEKVYLINELENFTVGRQLDLLSFSLYSINIRPHEACLEEEGCGDIPIVTCQEPVIVFRTGENSITTQDNCLILSAENNEEMQKFTERLIYKFLGVMN